MARLEAANGRWLDLTILAYEFPDIRTGHDANWLVIAITGEVGVQVPRIVGPFATSPGIRNLARWCRSVAAGQATLHRWFITSEPILWIRCDRWATSQQELLVELSTHGRNGFARFARRKLVVTPDALIAFAAALDNESQPFPVRAVGG